MELDSYKSLELDLDDGVLVVKINRPESLNAVNAELHTEFSRIFADIALDDAIRAVILTGNGKAFSAGGDLRWIKTVSPSYYSETLHRESRKVLADILNLEVPVIAAVNGAAIGFGATLALFCDIVIMGESASIADMHVSVGLAAGDGGAVVWPWLIGMNRAKEFLLTGDRLKASEAERLGLVNRVVPDDRLFDEAMALARRFRNGAPLAIRTTKRTMNRILADTLNLVGDLGLACEGETFVSADLKEGVAAFEERRPPRFTGR
jgi:enoyl-CoA hydratase